MQTGTESTPKTSCTRRPILNTLDMGNAQQLPSNGSTNVTKSLPNIFRRIFKGGMAKFYLGLRKGDLAFRRNVSFSRKCPTQKPAWHAAIRHFQERTRQPSSSPRRYLQGNQRYTIIKVNLHNKTVSCKQLLTTAALWRSQLTMVISIILFWWIGSTQTGMEAATDSFTAATARWVAIQCHCCPFIFTLRPTNITLFWFTLK